jgi:23S rRNA pseudouridine1911/1915/1917 synthase
MAIFEKTYKIIVPLDKKKDRLDKFLANNMPSVTRAKIKNLVDEKRVTVNGENQKAGYIIRPNEEIIVNFPPAQKAGLGPENIPLDIVHEDEHLIIVNKPAGMVVHPAVNNWNGTLVNALIYHCQSLSDVGGVSRPGLVHRLDKDTSGLLVIAKNDVAHVKLAKQLSTRKMEREYRAIVWGRFKKPTGTINAALARSPKDYQKIIIHPDGKHAITHYQVLEEFPLMSLLKLNLETGRTHQIRVHMTSIGHPIFSDAAYGGRGKLLAGLNHTRSLFVTNLLKQFKRQMLHAKTLAFVHPTETEKLSRYDSPLPQDMADLLDILLNDSM